MAELSQRCSWIAESEIQDLLKNYDGLIFFFFSCKSCLQEKIKKQIHKVIANRAVSHSDCWTESRWHYERGWNMTEIHDQGFAWTPESQLVIQTHWRGFQQDAPLCCCLYLAPSLFFRHMIHHGQNGAMLLFILHSLHISDFTNLQKIVLNEYLKTIFNLIYRRSLKLLFLLLTNK